MSEDEDEEENLAAFEGDLPGMRVIDDMIMTEEQFQEAFGEDEASEAKRRKAYRNGIVGKEHRRVVEKCQIC